VKGQTWSDLRGGGFEPQARKRAGNT